MAKVPGFAKAFAGRWRIVEGLRGVLMEGHDENDPACGRGWVMIGAVGKLVGHFYIHNRHDSRFVCECG